MQTYEILVRGRAVHPNSDDMTLVRTSIGIDKIHVLFDNDEWLDFALTVTFAQGGADGPKVTQSLTPSTISGTEWVAEAECVIPYEVIEMTGPIRVTFQGYDTDGNHIITAAGAPLSVEEAGDVDDGEPPEPVPTISQWEQAYADAMAAAASALSAAAAAQEAIDEIEHMELPIASTSQLGGVKVDGTTITAASDGTISGVEQYELPIATDTDLGGVIVDDSTVEVTQLGVISLAADLASALANLRRLASTAFDSTFVDGELTAASVKPASLPIATTSALGGVKPDGTSITIDSNGVISGSGSTYTLPAATMSTLGGVKPDGTTITVDGNGVISGASTYELPKASTSTLGGVKVDGTTITADSNGVISGASTYTLPTASTSTLGGVKVDGTTVTINANGVISSASESPADYLALLDENSYYEGYTNVLANMGDLLTAKVVAPTYSTPPDAPITSIVVKASDETQSFDYMDKSLTFTLGDYFWPVAGSVHHKPDELRIAHGQATLIRYSYCIYIDGTEASYNQSIVEESRRRLQGQDVSSDDAEEIAYVIADVMGVDYQTLTKSAILAYTESNPFLYYGDLYFPVEVPLNVGFSSSWTSDEESFYIAAQMSFADSSSDVDGVVAAYVVNPEMNILKPDNTTIKVDPSGKLYVDTAAVAAAINS